MLSNRIQKMQFSPIRKFTPFAEAAKAKGKTVYHLNIGQPDIPTPKEFLNKIRSFDENILKYAKSEGLDSLRKDFSDFYKSQSIDLNEDEILITSGGSEALIFALNILCDYGDEIIIPEPFYTNYNGFAMFSGVKIVPLTTRIEDGFIPNISDMEKLITNKTKAILISSPNNPTGAVYSNSNFEEIISFAHEHDLYIISDEVYREFVFDGYTPISMMNFPEAYNRLIMVDSVSKRWSSCGARIGVFATKNEKIMESAKKLAQSRLSVPTIEQFAASEFTKLGNDYLKDIIETYRKRRNVVFRELKNIDGAFFTIPHGAFYTVVRLPIDDAEKFVLWLLNDFDLDNETVMLAPASAFYATEGMGKDEVRIAYVLNEARMIRAMQILKKAIEVYPGRKI
jgi:aspartate aminotransferase